MAVHQLSEHFSYFFTRINPSKTWIDRASSQYNSIKGLLESAENDASVLAPQVFLQGSYSRETAIYAINDIDIVALCKLWYPPSQGGGQGWGRDRIFKALAQPLLAYGPYSDAVSYRPQSMCIKLDLGIKVEILPVVFEAGNNDAAKEPFYLYRPEKGQWEKGFARYHQWYLTEKNKQTGGNFIPCVKVLKHIRSHFNLDAVSFHIECLLHSFHNNSLLDSPADYINNVLTIISSSTAETWWGLPITTPCGERKLFSASEWGWESWVLFHGLISKAQPWISEAVRTTDRSRAIECWQTVLGKDFFPAY